MSPQIIAPIISDIIVSESSGGACLFDPNNHNAQVSILNSLHATFLHPNLTFLFIEIKKYIQYTMYIICSYVKRISKQCRLYKPQENAIIHLDCIFNQIVIADFIRVNVCISEPSETQSAILYASKKVQL